MMMWIQISGVRWKQYHTLYTVCTPPVLSGFCFAPWDDQNYTALTYTVYLDTLCTFIYCCNTVTTQQQQTKFRLDGKNNLAYLSHIFPIFWNHALISHALVLRKLSKIPVLNCYRSTIWRPQACVGAFTTKSKQSCAGTVTPIVEYLTVPGIPCGSHRNWGGTETLNVE